MYLDSDQTPEDAGPLGMGPLAGARGLNRRRTRSAGAERAAEPRDKSGAADPETTPEKRGGKWKFKRM